MGKKSAANNKRDEKKAEKKSIDEIQVPLHECDLDTAVPSCINGSRRLMLSDAIFRQLKIKLGDWIQLDRSGALVGLI